MNAAHALQRISAILLAALPAVYFFLLLSFNDYLLAHPATQLWLTRSWVLTLFVYLFLLFGKKTTNKLQAVKDFLFEPMTPLNLAVFRIAHFSFYFAAIFFFQMNIGKKMTMGYEYFPRENRVAIPGAEWYSLHVPVTPEMIDTLAPVFNISAILMFFGLFTRVSSLVFLLTALYLASVHQMFGKVGNSHYLIWFPAILAFSDCGRMLSLDALIRKYILKKPFEIASSPQYGFPIKNAILLLGIIYFFPGFWKIWNGGFDWIFRQNLSYHMYFKWASLDYWTPFFRVDHYPLLIILGSIFTIAFELGFIFLALKPAYRVGLAVAGAVLHTAIYVFMKIAFFLLMANYAVLINWEKVFPGFLKKEPLFETNGIPWKKMRGAIAVSIILITGNLIFGFEKITGYPFACFPTFDNIMPHTTTRIQYTGYKNGIVSLSSEQVRQRLLESRPVSNLSNVEDVLLNNWAIADSAAALSGIRQLFTFPEHFADVDSVTLHRVTHPMQPERRGELTERLPLGIFFLETDSILLH